MRNDLDHSPLTRAVAMRGTFWAVLGSLLRYVLSGVTTLLLSRLLDPQDFGVIALTIAAQELIANVAPVGFHDALIQRTRLSDADLDAAFWSIIALSGGFVLLTIVLSPLIGTWFGQSLLGPLLIGVALASLLRAASMLPRALLTRQMDFRTPSLVRVVGMVLGGGVAVICAAAGAGPWSLVARLFVVNAVGLVLVWRAVGWHPHWRLPHEPLRGLWAFAVSVSAFAILSYVVSNADNQIVGFRLGSQALGYYVMAYSFMAWPVRDVLGGASVVLYPVFVRYQNDLPRLREVYFRSLRLSAVFAFPTLTVIAVIAPRFVPLVLGEKWTPIVLTVQILAISGIRESTLVFNGAIYRAVGRPNVHAMFGVVNMVCYVVAFWVGVNFGIAGVAFFYALVGVLLHGVSLWVLGGVLYFDVRRWFAVVVPVLVCSLVLGGVVHGGLVWFHITTLLGLFGLLAFSGVVYGALLCILFFGFGLWVNDYTK